MLKSIVASILIAIMLAQPSIAIFKTQNFSTSQNDQIEFVENISREKITTNEKIIATIQLDYEANNIGVFRSVATDDLATNKDLVRKVRQSNKEYYSSRNAKFIKESGISYDNMQISSYSPFVFIEFDSYSEYQAEKDKLVAVAEKQKLGNVDVTVVSETNIKELSAVVAPVDTIPPVIYMNNAKAIIGTQNSVYKGDGINVGFAEDTYPNDLTNFDNTSVTTRTSIVDNVGFHATKTASIAGGTYGIASEIDLFFADDITNVGIEWLIEQGCLIINISAGFLSDSPEEDDGYYWLYDAYIDYLAWSNLVCFVVASGNESVCSNSYVAHPATAQNVITVGNIDANQAISPESCYDLNSSLDAYLAKPTVVAPGQYIYIPSTDNSLYASCGTSFSAPMVTGMIALLMEEFSNLIMYPEIIIAAVVAGVNPLATQTDLWDERAGAGLINYVNTREILSSANYNGATVGNLTPSDILIADTVSVPNGDTLRYSFYGMYNSGVTVSGNTATHCTPNISRYVVVVYDSEGAVVSTMACTKNVSVNDFVNTSGEDQQYTIKVRLLFNKQLTTNDYISIAYRIYS